MSLSSWQRREWKKTEREGRADLEWEEEEGDIWVKCQLIQKQDELWDWGGVILGVYVCSQAVRLCLEWWKERRGVQGWGWRPVVRPDCPSAGWRLHVMMPLLLDIAGMMHSGQHLTRVIPVIKILSSSKALFPWAAVVRSKRPAEINLIQVNQWFSHFPLVLFTALTLQSSVSATWQEQIPLWVFLRLVAACLLYSYSTLNFKK